MDERDWVEEAIRRVFGRPAGRAALRASDSERESVATRLRDGHAEGRLTSVEFEDRINRCYRARTQGELERLVRDLPLPPAPVAVRRRPWFVPLAVVLLVAAAAGTGRGAVVAVLAVVLVLWLVSTRRGFVRR